MWPLKAKVSFHRMEKIFLRQQNLGMIGQQEVNFCNLTSDLFIAQQWTTHKYYTVFCSRVYINWLEIKALLDHISLNSSD